MKFLLEIDRFGCVTHDDAKYLLQLADAYKSWGRPYIVDTAMIDDIHQIDIHSKQWEEYQDFVPVGSVEFVRAFACLYYMSHYKEHPGSKPEIIAKNAIIRPINVPEELCPTLYSGRVIYNVHSDDEAIQLCKKLTNSGKLCQRWHIKDIDVIKHPDNHFYDIIQDLRGGMMTCECRIGEDGQSVTKVFDYDAAKKFVGKQISTVVPDIVSEWRIFVDKKDLRGPVVGCENYTGDPIMFPRRDRIMQFIDAYKSSPEVYTLDVMVDSHGNTWVLECHEFFSYGLYGFEYISIPYMINRAWQAIKHRLDKSV